MFGFASIIGTSEKRLFYYDFITEKLKKMSAIYNPRSPLLKVCANCSKS